MSENPLPTSRQDCQTDHYGNIIDLMPPNSRQVLRIALNLKYLIDKLIPIAIDESEIVKDGSNVLTPKVIQLTYEACGGDQSNKEYQQKYRAVLVFCLIKVSSWYNQLSSVEISNSKLYDVRSITAQQLAKIIIAKEEKKNLHFLFMQMLLRKYAINENDKDVEPTNAVEMATDLHCTIVIGSNGFQRCLRWLWRGWIVQSRHDPMIFIKEERIASTKFWHHFNPERIKTPKYQNILQIIFSILFLLIFTSVVNGKSGTTVAPLAPIEGIFFVFTFGYICDEIFKLYYVGVAYFSFWTLFNDTLYLVILFSMFFRFNSIFPTFLKNRPPEYWDRISYRLLSCAAPLVWSRLLLYLESERFVGAMMVVLKHMMKESLVFFVLLILIMLGFVQGFLGLDLSDGEREITAPILTNLVITVFGMGSFDAFEHFAPPYAAFLYYSYCFIVSVILLNILIALYSNAYQHVVENADDEYMALMSQKTLRFIRAPDEDVYVSPLNLIELCFKPIMCLLNEERRKDLNYLVMLILYSPMLTYVVSKEIREAKRIKYNRMKNLPDDSNEVDTPWDLGDGFFDFDESLFGYSDDRNGFRATLSMNRRSQQLQREAERSDKNFSVKNDWFKEVKRISNPREPAISSELSALEERLNKMNQHTNKESEGIRKDIQKLLALKSNDEDRPIWN